MEDTLRLGEIKANLNAKSERKGIENIVATIFSRNTSLASIKSQNIPFTYIKHLLF